MVKELFGVFRGIFGVSFWIDILLQPCISVGINTSFICWKGNWFILQIHGQNVTATTCQFDGVVLHVATLPLNPSPCSPRFNHSHDEGYAKLVCYINHITLAVNLRSINHATVSNNTTIAILIPLFRVTWNGRINPGWAEFGSGCRDGILGPVRGHKLQGKRVSRYRSDWFPIGN